MNIYLNLRKYFWLFFILAVLLTVCYFIIAVREPNSVLRKRFGNWFILSSLIKERDRTYAEAKYIELSQKAPSMEYLVKFMFGADREGALNLQDYLFYYELIANYFPDTSESYGMLGYCYFYLGQVEKSKELFFKARALNRDFFWYSFNLGMIHVRLNELQEAEIFFQEAREMDAKQFQKTLELLLNSPIFQQIFSKVEGMSVEYLRNNLLNGYQMIRQRKTFSSSEVQLRLF